ncbi:MAG: MBL fold metallo-hydrolase [Sphingomonadales bacterium]
MKKIFLQFGFPALSLFFVALVFPGAIFPAQAQAPAPGTKDPKSSEAAELLERAAKVEGAAKLAELQGLILGLSGENRNQRQAYSLTGIAPPEEKESHLSYSFHDFRGKRYRLYSRENYYGGHDLRFETLYKEGVRYNITTQMRRYTKGEGGFDGGFSSLAVLPGFIILKALERPATLTLIESGEDIAKGEIAVEFDWRYGGRRRIYLDKETASVLRLVWSRGDAITGTRKIERRFEGRQELSGLSVPMVIMTYVNGRLWNSRTVTLVQPDPEFQPGTFELDSDLVPFGDDGRVSPKHQRLGGAVHEISGFGGGLYRVIYVEFPSFVVVFDAILADSISDTAQDMIARLTGGKPIKYVVLSHNHTDHIRGLKSYAAAGAQFVVSPETAQRLAQFLGDPEEEEEALALKPIIVARGRELSIRERGVEMIVHNLGRTPHVSGLLTAELTRQKTFLQADGYFRFSSFGAMFDYYLNWVRNRGYQRPLIVGVHSGLVRLGEIERAAVEDREGFTPKYLTDHDLKGE